MNKKLILTTLLYAITTSLYPQNPPDSENSLARVAVLPFQDNTGTDNFEYMKVSLSDAVDASLQKRFEYIRIAPAAAAETAKTIIKTKGLPDETEFAALSNALLADIIIAGSYTFNKESNQLAFETAIYVHTDKTAARLAPVERTVDNTIFEATDQTAAAIVTELERMAREAREAKEAAKGDDKPEDTTTVEETDEKGKIRLEKEEVKITPVETQPVYQKWQLAAGLGVTKTMNVLDQFYPLGLTADFTLRYRLTPDWYIGGNFGAYLFGADSDSNVAGTEMRYLSLQAVGGYIIDLNQTNRLLFELGTGAYALQVGEYFNDKTYGFIGFTPSARIIYQYQFSENLLLGGGIAIRTVINNNDEIINSGGFFETAYSF